MTQPLPPEPVDNFLDDQRLPATLEAAMTATTVTTQLVIGTSNRCQFRVHDDPYVSPEHAVVAVVSESECYLADLGSTNGTWLIRDGAKIRVTTPTLLQVGDTIRVGRTNMPWRRP